MSVVLQVSVLIAPELVGSPERMDDLLRKIADFSPILQEIGGVLEEALAENFETQGFGQWAPLAVSTVRDRFRRGYGPNQPLVRSGTLLEALTEPGGEGHKFLVQPDSVSVGVYGDAVAYAQFLNDGTSKMPARLLVQLTPGTVDRILALIVEWLGGPEGVSVTADLPEQV